MERKHSLAAATSMGVRITPIQQQPVGTGNFYRMYSTSAESNVLNVSASLGLRTLGYGKGHCALYRPCV